MSKAQFAIISTGEVPCGIYPDRTPLEIACSVGFQAIQDAGINKNEIDAVFGAGAILDNDWGTEITFGRIPEALGLKNCKMIAMAHAGGSTTYALQKMAQGVLSTGEANMVLCVHAQRFSAFTPAQQAEGFARAGSDPEWEFPYGLGYNALTGMMAERYMYETGASLEHFAAVIVSHRKWAQLQQNAMSKKDLTLEQVLKAKVVSTPYTSYMSNILADGGSAFIMTTAERARKLVSKPVYILGEGSAFSHRNLTKAKNIVRIVNKEAADEAYKRAGMGPKDMDIAQVYASYPANTLAMFEDFGFAEPGEGGRFFLEGHTWPGGKLPTTTMGDSNSFGHTGTGVGMYNLCESVRQLQGKAGEAQVPGARFLLENTAGGAYMDCHCSILGNELP